MHGLALVSMFTILMLPAQGRVHVKGEAGLVLVRAVRDAGTRLREPACRAVLGDFGPTAESDMEGRLAGSGLAAEEWLGRLVFADGVGQAACRRSEVLFATEPGSRVVFACGPRFLVLASSDPDLAASLVIHETLHTLGLPEAPPTSGEITARVRKRCGP